MNLTVEFAEVLIKSPTASHEVSCHNDRWIETYCVHCDATNYSGKITHKPECVVLKARQFLLGQ